MLKCILQSNHLIIDRPLVHFPCEICFSKPLVGFFLWGNLMEHTMKLILLTQNKFTIVDDEDFEELNKHKWCASKTSKNNHGGYYAAKKIDKYPHQKALFMHRKITNCPEGLQVDHINHNTLDNRRCNLRICTHAENQHNRKPQAGGSSQYKGVCWNKQHKKWVVRITLNGKEMYLGYFNDEIEAAKEYDRAAKELFGKFAYLNFSHLWGKK